VERIQVEMARREIEGEAEMRKQEAMERSRRHLTTARRIGAIADKKLNNNAFANKVSQPRDVLQYARTAINLEREITGDARPREEKPYMNTNILVQISSEVEAKRREWKEAMLKEYERALASGMSPQDAATSANNILQILTGGPIQPPETITVVQAEPPAYLPPTPTEPAAGEPEPMAGKETTPTEPTATEPTPPRATPPLAAERYGYRSTLPPRDER
jgi:hypothetical protein